MHQTAPGCFVPQAWPDSRPKAAACGAARRSPGASAASPWITGKPAPAGKRLIYRLAAFDGQELPQLFVIAGFANGGHQIVARSLRDARSVLDRDRAVVGRDFQRR